ncbi:MAG: hypothetical protein IPO91_28900 [Chloroflexi bacterium]|nr:hypothetical protein [Chloroflexota bacterium]
MFRVIIATLALTLVVAFGLVQAQEDPTPTPTSTSEFPVSTIPATTSIRFNLNVTATDTYHAGRNVGFASTRIDTEEVYTEYTFYITRYDGTQASPMPYYPLNSFSPGETASYTRCLSNFNWDDTIRLTLDLEGKRWDTSDLVEFSFSSSSPYYERSISIRDLLRGSARILQSPSDGISLRASVGTGGADQALYTFTYSFEAVTGMC